jgi:hypothetical protein
MTIDTQLKLIEVLKAGKAKIIKPENWGIGFFAKTKDGQQCPYNSKAAFCFCSDGALMNVTSWDRSTENSVIYWEAYALLGSLADEHDIIEFNDTHTHEEVLTLWDKAIKLAEADLVVMNLERLIAAVKIQPEALFDLRSFRETKDCGTQFCTAGLACTLPEFNAQGLRWTGTIVKMDGRYLDDDESSIHKVFGTSAWENLFSMRDIGNLDTSHPNYNEEDGVVGSATTDKSLALWRLDWQLNAYKDLTTSLRAN